MNSIAKNIDCMLGMAEYPDKYFELAIVDPPYGIGISKTGCVGGNNLTVAKDYGSKKWDNAIPDKTYFNELFRVSKNQIIWGQNYFPYYWGCGLIVWDKDNADNNFNDCETAFQSLNNSVKKYRFKWEGMLQGDMKNKETRIHPTQKPVKLYKWLLDKYAKQGDKILDTHLGSGSSRIACYDYGFEFTGFELDKDYFEAQEKRFNNHISQTHLFKAV